ncbi:MAG: F-box protein [Sedimenticola sp.]
MLLKLPSHLTILILKYLTLQELLTSVSRTCKLLYSIVQENSILWTNFEFDFPLKLSETHLKRITRHSRTFRCFAIPGAQFLCDVPSIDLVLTRGVCTATSLRFLDLTDVPISTLCFLKEVPTLEILNVSYCRNLSDTDFNAIRYCRKLTHLYVSFTSIRPVTLVSISTNLHTIKVLDACGIHMHTLDCESILQHTFRSLLYFHISLSTSESVSIFRQRLNDKYTNTSFIITPR